MLQTSYLLMKSVNKTETPIFLSVVCSLFPKAIFLTFILVALSSNKAILCMNTNMVEPNVLSFMPTNLLIEVVILMHIITYNYFLLNIVLKWSVRTIE